MVNAKEDEKLNRHALVVAVWSPIIFVAAIALQIGIVIYSPVWIAAAYIIILLGFVCHIVVNAALKTEFTKGETALGAVSFSCAVMFFAISCLVFESENLKRLILPMSAGFSSLISAVIIYLLIIYGPRKSLEKFDVIRNNNSRDASYLGHRGGRR